MMDYCAVSINGTNILKKYKAPLYELHNVQPPEVKSFYQEVPGADGSLDLTTAIAGRPTYNRRAITMNFQCEYPINKWTSVMSELLKEFHGKDGKIIFSDDPDYFYLGRIEISNYERKVQFGSFTIKADVEPYKNELLSSIEDWLWDPFNFKTGLIRAYGNLTVDGTRTLIIPGTEKWVIPEFKTEGNIKVTYEEKTYDLQQGLSKIYPIVIKPGNNTLVFTGNGIVSVNYRGGIL